MRKVIFLLLVSAAYLFSQPISFRYCRNGLQKFDKKKFDEAFVDFDKAVRLSPFNSTYYYFRAITRYKLKDTTGALADLNKALELNPKDVDALIDRSNVKKDLKDWKGSVKDVSDAWDLCNPNEWFNHYEDGMKKFNDNDYEGAVQDFTKSIEIYLDFKAAYYYRGLSKSKLGDKSGACNDWKQALKLGEKKATKLIKKYCK